MAWCLGECLAEGCSFCFSWPWCLNPFAQLPPRQDTPSIENFFVLFSTTVYAQLMLNNKYPWTEILIRDSRKDHLVCSPEVKTIKTIITWAQIRHVPFRYLFAHPTDYLWPVSPTPIPPNSKKLSNDEPWPVTLSCTWVSVFKTARKCR